MLLGGDEFGRSQRGSNNAYCQDSPLNWIDWSLIDANPEILEFVQQCAELRRGEPALRIEQFPDDELHEEDPWIWFVESGERLTADDWNDPERRSFGIMIEAIGDRQPAWLLLLFNATGDVAEFQLPTSLAETGQTIEIVLSSALIEHGQLQIPPGSLAVYRVSPT